MIEKSKYVIEKWEGDGIPFDESCGNFHFCHDPSHHYDPSTGVDMGLLELLKRIRTEVK